MNRKLRPDEVEKTVPKVDQKVIPKVEFWGSDENPRCGIESENVFLKNYEMSQKITK